MNPHLISASSSSRAPLLEFSIATGAQSPNWKPLGLLPLAYILFIFLSDSLWSLHPPLHPITNMVFWLSPNLPRLFYYHSLVSLPQPPYGWLLHPASVMVTVVPESPPKVLFHYTKASNYSLHKSFMISADHCWSLLFPLLFPGSTSCSNCTETIVTYLYALLILNSMPLWKQNPA